MSVVVLSLLAALGLVAMGDPRVGSGIPAALGLMVVWGLAATLMPGPRAGLRALFFVALALRIILVCAPPWLSDDLYRYLWEGRAVLSGGDPFQHAPGWAGWDQQFGADPLRARVNHPDISTIYPPLAQWLFAGLGALSYSVWSIKAAMGLADAGTALAIGLVLRGRRRALTGAWIYALHPLAVVESAGSGHLDSLAVLLLVLAILAADRGWYGRATWAAGLGALIKLFPGVLLPTLLLAPGPKRSRGLALLGLAALGLGTAWPFLDAALGRGLGTYAARWSFNGSLFPLIQAGFDAAGWHDGARPTAILIGAATVAFAFFKRRDPAELALWAGGAAVLLSPTVHPWYIAWAWVPALICGWRAWTALATLAPLAYVVLTTLDPSTGVWRESPWTGAAITLPFLAIWLLESVWRLTRPGPWDASPATPESPSSCPTTPDPSMSPPR